MKKIFKIVLGVTAVAAASAGIFLLSCRVNKGSANVAFAETPAKTRTSSVELPQDSLAVTQALQGTFRSISSQVLPAVVEVDVTTKTKVQNYNPFKDIPFFNNIPGFGDDEDREYESSALGSGVIVRRNGKTFYVLTNNHVVEKSSTIKIKLNDEREFEGKLVGADERIDIALVSFESDDQSITVAQLGNSDEVQQGDIVLALGSPLGYFASVTQGIVSATGRSGGGIGSISDFIQTDAAINQGNSGGPLVNIYGEVIGINTWIASQSGGSQGLGFSIPINNIKTAIDQFINKGKISYGWLGVSLLEVTQEYKDALEVGKQSGALAAEIFIGSPAMKGGMQAGDYIIALNGKDVKDVNQLVRDVGSIPAGETATITVKRGTSTLDLKIRMDEREDSVVSDSGKLWPGFVATPLTDDTRKKIKVPAKIKGVLVADVQEKSPAAALRLQKGDVVTAVNDRKVTTVAEFYEALNLSDKTEIWFDVYSDGHTISTGHYKVEE